MNTKRVVAHVDPKLHKAALVASAITGKSLRQAVEDALREWVKRIPAARAILEGKDGD